jgi:hypothetical protein
MFAGQLLGNEPLQQERSCAFCVAWSVPQLQQRVRELVLSVGDSHRMLVVESELEVSL